MVHFFDRYWLIHSTLGMIILHRLAQDLSVLTVPPGPRSGDAPNTLQLPTLLMFTWAFPSEQPNIPATHSGPIKQIEKEPRLVYHGALGLFSCRYYWFPSSRGRVSFPDYHLLNTQVIKAPHKLLHFPHVRGFQRSCVKQRESGNDNLVNTDSQRVAWG